MLAACEGISTMSTTEIVQTYLRRGALGVPCRWVDRLSRPVSAYDPRAMVCKKSFSSDRFATGTSCSAAGARYFHDVVASRTTRLRD